MKLKKVLDAHLQFSDANSLRDNLGDGFLLKHNLIFRNIRTAALKRGLRFTSDRFHDYDVLPLTQLPKILASKTVPYLPNVHPLQEIETAMPGVFELNETPPLRANYVLHETAHVLVRMLRLERLGEAGGSSIEQQRELALYVMMEEAFANAAESLLSAYADSAIHDELLARNTYIFEKPNTRKRMHAAIKLVGLKSTFRLIFLSFVFSNFMKEKVSVAEWKRVMKIALRNEEKKISDRDQQMLRTVFDGGFDLDPLFITLTNSFCLRMMKITVGLDRLFAFDFLKSFESDPRFEQFMRAAEELMESGKIA